MQDTGCGRREMGDWTAVRLKYEIRNKLYVGNQKYQNLKNANYKALTQKS